MRHLIKIVSSYVLDRVNHDQVQHNVVFQYQRSLKSNILYADPILARKRVIITLLDHTKWPFRSIFIEIWKKCVSVCVWCRPSLPECQIAWEDCWWHMAYEVVHIEWLFQAEILLNGMIWDNHRQANFLPDPTKYHRIIRNKKKKCN